MTRNYRNIVISQNQFNLIAEGVNSHLCYYQPIEKGEYVAIYGDRDEKLEKPIHVIITDSKRDDTDYPEYRFQRIDEGKENEVTIGEVVNNVAKVIFAKQLMDFKFRMAMAGVPMPK